MTRMIVRLGDTSNHGGAVVTSSADYKAEGKFVARIGDILNCPIHGPNPIVEGSDTHLNNGKKVARHGDHTQCGATLIASATKTAVN